MRTSRLRVTMRDVEPVIRRVIDVPVAVTLAELHHLLQAALGWTNSHLHQFATDDAVYGVPDLDGPAGVRDEAGARLRDLPARFTYRYDFGDGWEHDVEVIGAGGGEPGCQYGEGPCPPEDCGGPPGYAELLAVLADPSHAKHAHMTSWAGDLADFDQETADARVRRESARSPRACASSSILPPQGCGSPPGGGSLAHSSGRSRNGTLIGARGASRPRSRKTWSRSSPCTTCSARRACCGSATGCSNPSIPPTTISR